MKGFYVVDTPEHWTNGGTAITNFSRESYHIYQRAINEYKGPSRLWISTKPMMPLKHDNGKNFSLHADLDKNRRGLDDFWRLFDKIRKEIAAQPENAS